MMQRLTLIIKTNFLPFDIELIILYWIQVQLQNTSHPIIIYKYGLWVGVILTNMCFYKICINQLTKIYSTLKNHHSKIFSLFCFSQFSIDTEVSQIQLCSVVKQ